MGTVIRFPGHSAASSTGTKSFAVTKSPVAVLIAMAKSFDSQTLPRRKRDTVVRSHDTPLSRINEAIPSSSNPLADMNFANSMWSNVHQVHNQVKPNCGFGAVEGARYPVHYVHMAKNSLKMNTKQRLAVRRFKPTFLREYRVAKGMSQSEAADALGYSDHTTLSKIENGKQPYDQALLEEAAILYDTSVWHLLFAPPGTTISDAIRIFQEATRPSK